MSAFKNLLIKELKSIIRDPKMLIAMFIVPLFMMAIMYGIMVLGIRQQVEQTIRETDKVIVIDLDNGIWSREFIEFLKDRGVTPILFNKEVDIVSVLEKYKTRIAFYIPSNFSTLLTENKTAYIEYYVLFKSLTFVETGIAGRASSLIESFSENITRSIIARIGVSKEFAENPVNATSRVIIGGKMIERPEVVFISITFVSTMIPLLVFVMLIFIIQFAVTSMAVEKEEKMFETLLTLPVSRLSILGVKLLVSVLIGIAYVLIYGAIFASFFLGAMTVPGEASIPSISLTSILPPQTLYYIGIGLVGGVVFGLLLATITSLFAEDVRTAQLISNYILAPLIIMFFIPMFVDISGFSYSAKLSLSLIPLANIGLIPKFIIIGNDELGLIAGVSNIIYAIIALAVAYKIVNTERVFTARLFKKKALLKRR